MQNVMLIYDLQGDPVSLVIQLLLVRHRGLEVTLSLDTPRKCLPQPALLERMWCGKATPSFM